MVRLTLYVKQGCWLCDTAEEMLAGLRERYDLRVNRVDIGPGGGLYELYRFDVPVIEFADGTTLNGRIKRKDFIRCVDGHQE
jgi:hypothetical protein